MTYSLVAHCDFFTDFQYYWAICSVGVQMFCLFYNCLFQWFRSPIIADITVDIHIMWKEMAPAFCN